MKVTLELIADSLAKMYPEAMHTYAGKALAKLGQLRTTKDIGLEVQILQKTFHEEVERIIKNRESTPEPKPLAVEEPAHNPPHQPTSVQKPEAKQLPEFLKDIIREAK